VRIEGEIAGAGERGRVLYVVPTSFRLHHHLGGQLARLVERGFEVEVASEPDDRGRAAARREGVELVPIDLRPALHPVLDLVAVWTLARRLLGRRFDVVNCSTKKGGFYGTLLGRFLGGASTVYVVYGIDRTSPGPLRRVLFHGLEWMTCHLADRVIFLSGSTRDSFVDRGVCPADRAVILSGGSSNGVDTDRFRRSEALVEQGGRLRRKLDVPDDGFVIGFVGRLTREKGIAELWDAWREAADRDRDLHLLVLAPPEVDPAVRVQVEELRRHPRVHMLGFVPDPRVGYAAMDLLVLPSHDQTEGLPNVILEAGSMERPILATRVAGCRDAVVEGRTGVLVGASRSG
jgi:glycosyltransferase involved in cell wall biosynthesis